MRSEGCLWQSPASLSSVHPSLPFQPPPPEFSKTGLLADWQDYINMCIF